MVNKDTKATIIIILVILSLALTVVGIACYDYLLKTEWMETLWIFISPIIYIIFEISYIIEERKQKDEDKSSLGDFFGMNLFILFLSVLSPFLIFTVLGYYTVGKELIKHWQIPLTLLGIGLLGLVKWWVWKYILWKGKPKKMNNWRS